MIMSDGTGCDLWKAPGSLCFKKKHQIHINHLFNTLMQSWELLLPKIKPLWTRREHLLPAAMEHWNRYHKHRGQKKFPILGACWPTTLPQQNSVTSSSSEQRGQSIHLYYVITRPNTASSLQKHRWDPYVIWLQMWDLTQYINDL